MKVELRGLQIFGHHGVGEDEREKGQLFLYDIELEVGERGAGDRIEDAVDYREVAATAREVSESRQFRRVLTSISTLLPGSIFIARMRYTAESMSLTGFSNEPSKLETWCLLFILLP